MAIGPASVRDLPPQDVAATATATGPATATPTGSATGLATARPDGGVAATTEAAGSARPTATPAAAGEVAARREELTERALGYARASRAAATWRAYEARWARFARWCAEHGERAYPAEPLTICRFLADLAPAWRPATPADHAARLSDPARPGIVAGHILLRPGVRPSTVAGYLAAISVAHQAAPATRTSPVTALTAPDTTPAGHGHGPAFAATDPAGPGPGPAANPARHEMVRQVMAGISRHPTVAAVRRRTALRPDDLRAILAALDPAQQPSRLATARDTALLLVGWKAALRTDDLARLDITDLVVTDAGLTVHLRRSKTDQAAAGDAIGIAASAPEDPLDAVAAWSTWRELLASHGLHTGPAWRGIDRYGRRPRATGLTTKSLGTIITRRAAAAGLDGDYGGHSLRRGFATSALAGGADERAVQRHGRWRSPTSMAPYVDNARRFAPTNPTRFLA